MKIIGLLICRNESWILPTTLPQQLRFVDELLVLDGRSTDNTRDILKRAGKQVHVRIQKGKTANYAQWRQELMQWARERGATHIVSLDGDEALSSNLLDGWNELLASMKPGEKLSLDWISLWKSPYHYLTQGSVFAHLVKDFIFCDDGISAYEKIALHEGRTPGQMTASNNRVLPRKVGVTLHFQFVPWERVQMKQAYIRCLDYSTGSDTPKGINYKYEETLETDRVRTDKVPAEWISGMKMQKNLASMPHDWFYDALIAKFDEKGIEYFEPMQIWHIPKLHEEFTKRMHREPQTQTYSWAARAARKATGKALSWFPANARNSLFSTIKTINSKIGL